MQLTEILMLILRWHSRAVLTAAHCYSVGGTGSYWQDFALLWWLPDKLKNSSHSYTVVIPRWHWWLLARLCPSVVAPWSAQEQFSLLLTAMSSVLMSKALQNSANIFNFKKASDSIILQVFSGSGCPRRVLSSHRTEKACQSSHFNHHHIYRENSTILSNYYL